jgi:hypothetical protein
MPAAGGVLAVDLGVNAGWCYGGVSDTKPDWGGWTLPAIGDLRDIEGDEARRSLLTGARGAALENELEALMSLVQPATMIMALRFAASQTSAYLLTGLAVAAEISAYRAGVRRVEKVAETTARQHVLGRGVFGARDPDNRNRIIKGTGTAATKEAVMEWCRGRGWSVPNHDVGDAAVLWEYGRRLEAARKQWAPAKTGKQGGKEW